jgi:hypothetical protein
MKRKIILVCLGGALVAGLLYAAGVNGYFDFFKIAAPANPATGQARVYVDSGTNKLACLNSDGSSCAPTGGGGATTQPQQVQSIAIRGNPLASAAMTTDVASGDVMIVAIGWFQGANAPSSLIDSLSTSYTKVAEVTGSGGTNAALFVGTLTASGALTITPTFPSGAGFEGITASEFLGSSVTATVDVSGSGQTALTLTTTTDGDLIWTYAENSSNGVSLGAPPGFFQGIQATSSDSCSFAFMVQPKAAKIFASMFRINNPYNDTYVAVALKHP